MSTDLKKPLDESRIAATFENPAAIQQQTLSWPRWPSGWASTSRIRIGSPGCGGSGLGFNGAQILRTCCGLLQVFNCEDCNNTKSVLDGMWVVPEEELFPSLWSLAASKLLATGRVSALPKLFANLVKEEFVDDQGTEVAGWDEMGNEVPRPEEVQLAQLKEGLMTEEEGEDLAEDRRYGGGRDMEPEELIAEEHRDGVGEIKFPQECYQGRLCGYIKLGGWIHWWQDRGGDVNYPKCPDCKVKMTAPMLDWDSMARRFYAPVVDFMQVS